MIIGLTGTMGSGKGTISNHLRERGFNFITISDLIRDELIKRGLPLKRRELQNLGNEMRRLNGNDYWAKQAIKKIDLKNDWVIDGIRNLGEIEELRNLPDFILISVDAPEEIRLIRGQRRERIIDGRISSDPKDLKEFKKLEARDRGLGEPDYGQQVLQCIEKADYGIINDNSIERLKKQIDSIIDNHRN